ncbi:phage integrase family [Clostridium sp. CAG:964]|nr:phage integrase family [Clostridium sp. CAG:964]
MASIIKQKNKYAVVYNYKDPMGNTRQKWETFDTNAAAKKRKAQVEFEQQNGTFIVPTATTVADLLEEYCYVYGVNNWAMSTYNSKKGLMYNYIIPLIGDVKLDDISPRLMDKFYQSLLSVKTKVVNNKQPKSEFLTAHTVREIHKFLRSAFNQAVKWELMSRNPVLNANLPKEEHEKREIWTAETLLHALEVCDDDILSLAINLAFSCSLRMGELLGLTWNCVDISEKSIEENNVSIFINKELQRVNKDALEALDNKGIIKIFPRTLSNTHTNLVLKSPKTKTSVRKIFLPNTVAIMLIGRKKQIDEMIELFGDEYINNNLVFCHSSGRPMEGQVINRGLKKLIRDNNLPDVVFHSFRHASITYKLKWNGGDMKSVQGDSGHARMDMVADVYSHIIDEDRRFNAQKFDEQFYKAKGLRGVEEGKTAPMPKYESAIEMLDITAVSDEEIKAEVEKENPEDENAALLAKLLANPETATLLKVLAKSL